SEEVLSDERGGEADREHVEKVEQPGDRHRPAVRAVVVQGGSTEQFRKRTREDEEDHRQDKRVPRAAVRNLADDGGGDGDCAGAARERNERVPWGGFDQAAAAEPGQ